MTRQRGEKLLLIVSAERIQAEGGMRDTVTILPALYTPRGTMFVHDLGKKPHRRGFVDPWHVAQPFRPSPPEDSDLIAVASQRAKADHEILREGTWVPFIRLSSAGCFTTGEDIMPSQGGTHEQHVKAGQQSHKNEGDRRNQQQHAQDDGRRQAGAGGSGAGGSGAGNQRGGQQGGSGNFAQDRERASEAGRKGGRS